MHYIYHAVPAISGTWNSEAHTMLCRQSVDHGALVNVMRVEPELGTPARGGLPATTAERVAGGWRLSGHKLYAGVTTLLIRGFEPLADASDYGRELIPTVRAEVARRDREPAATR